MELQNRIKNAFAAFRKTNNQQSYDPSAFLRMGNRRVMPSDWSVPELSDKDFYTNYGWAVVNKRANRGVTLGKNYLFTNANDKIIETANEKGTKVTHPYLDLIRSSTDFSERDFWYNISTYLDLEGVYYLMAVRTVTKTGLVGNIQKFVLLNPYWTRPVCNVNGVVGGYVENNPYLGSREIPKEMIIPIKLLNPFDPTRPYSLADAARDSQFTLKQANDYARESISGNLNAPGIISSGIELPDDQFDNFVERIKHHGRGEPVFGNGVGTVNWVDMQVDLDKAALDDINSISRDTLFAVAGVSKSGMGVEEAGAGREVSRTQKDDFTENAVMPQIENIIDALNLDYRVYYNSTWTKNSYSIALDNPLATDREAEQLDVTIRTTEFALLQTLVDAGYEQDIAAKYAKGLISVTDLGEPTNDPKPDPVPPQPDQTPEGDGEDPNQPQPDNEDTDPTGDPKNKANDKVINQLAARDVPGLYDGLDIDMDELGCIMLDTATIPITPYVENLDDVYNDGTHSGLVGQTEPHVTLLFGLLENGNVWKQKVDQVLKGWSCNTVTIDSVSSFDLGESYAIVGLVDPSPQLIDGHERLTLLPHINTFSEYTPHITLAYVKHDESIRDKWVNSLNEQYANKEIVTKGINYGDLEVDSSVGPETYKNKAFDVYAGYPIPILQYLGEHAEQINPVSEKGSFVYSTESMLQMNAAKKTVTISRVDAIGNSLLGIVDETTFIKLGEFNNNADKVAIVSKLNKRYKNQPVALKKKIDLDHEDNVYEIIKNAAPFDKQAQVGQNTAQLQQSAAAAEESIYQWYVNQLNGGVTSPHLPSDQIKQFVNSLTVPFAVYFTVLFPTYAQARVRETSKEYDIPDTLPLISVTPQIKQMIQDFAQNEAQSHVNTIKTDIENALANIKATTSDPAEISTQFAAAFKQIQAERSLTIANNAAARIFNLSQYEADLQFLTKAGKIDQAYKVLFSLTGDPCPICASIIEQTNANPIPFTQNFVNLGDVIDAGKRKMTFNFEDITAGNVHPNCHCAYRLILNDTSADNA